MTRTTSAAPREATVSQPLKAMEKTVGIALANVAENGMLALGHSSCPGAARLTDMIASATTPVTPRRESPAGVWKNGDDHRGD